MFHMTLKYPMQLLDELPMIYGSCVFIYCMAQVKSGKSRAAASTSAAYDLWQLRLFYCMAQVKSGKNNRAAASTTAAYDL